MAADDKIFPNLEPVIDPVRPSRHGLWQRLRLVREDESPLAPIRRVFLGFTLLLLALDVPLLLFVSTAPRGPRMLGLLAIVVLVGGRLRGYLCGDPHWLGHIPDSLALMVLIHGLNSPVEALGAFYGGVCFLSLYGSAGRVAYQTGLYMLALALGAAWRAPDASDPTLVPTLLANFMSFCLLSALLYIVALTLRRHHAAMAREQVLTRAGTRLAAATDRDAIYRAAVEAALALAGDDPTARTGLSLRTEDGGMRVVRAVGHDVPADFAGSLPLAEYSAAHHAALRRHRVVMVREDELDRSPSLNGLTRKRGGVCIAPLLLQGELRGVLALSSDQPLSDELQRPLNQLATATALALESAAVADDRLRQQDARYRALVQHASDVVVVAAPDGRIQYVSPSVERVLGWTPETLVSQALAPLFAAESQPAVERAFATTLASVGAETLLDVQLPHADGGMRDAELRLTNLMHEPSVGGVVANVRDITERKALEAQLTREAFHDSLTGLANRALFRERTAQAFGRAATTGRAAAAVVIDLDTFKAINDRFGHAAGDVVLVEVAHRLGRTARVTDTVARLGGDELAMLLEDVASPDAAMAFAREVSQSIREPVQLGETELFLTASMGVALSEPGMHEPDELLRNADLAMYLAKQGGSGQVEPYRADMHADAAERLGLITDLRRALERNEFHLLYQPIVHMSDGQIESVEALVRWQHPDRGLVSPAQFIPVAEDTGLIVPLGRWVIETACRQASQWQADAQLAPVNVSVNLAARQLRQSDLVAQVAAVLSETGLDPARLVLELTESALQDDTPSILETLQGLKRLGVRLALDDFGTGYSSLSYLQKFPLDVLKIDKSFIDGLEAGATTDALVRTILSLSETLGLRTVAEGIEQPTQAARLRSLGCGLGQGYYFARPLSADRLRPMLEQAQTAVDERQAA